MLGLTQQVGGHPGGVTAAVGQNQDLAGACYHVDAHLAKDLPLGSGDIDIARADDLVHRRDALGAVGQRGHGLCAAGLEDPGHACGGRSGEDDRIDFTVLTGGSGHDDLRNARHLGRDDVHQDGGRIRRRAARDVDTRLLDGGVFLAQHDAGLVVHHKIFMHLLAVEGLDVGGGLPQRFEEIAVHIRKGFFNFLLRHLDVIQLGTVELEGVFFQGLVAPGADIGNDAVHHVFHILLRADVTVQYLFGLQFIEVIQLYHFFSSFAARVARSFSSISSISRCLNW